MRSVGVRIEIRALVVRPLTKREFPYLSRWISLLFPGKKLANLSHSCATGVQYLAAAVDREGVSGRCSKWFDWVVLGLAEACVLKVITANSWRSSKF